MSGDLATALADAGIVLRHHRPGKYRAPCSRCSRSVKESTCGITIKPDGSAVWGCFRCGWAGAWHPAKPRPERPTRRVEPAPATEPPATLAPRWLAFWNECRPIAPNDPAGLYLEGRCCAIPKPHAVRWHPETWHPQERRTMPAIVALITDVRTVEPRSLHFTYLREDGSGKAAIERPRLYLAGHSKAGGVVRLHPDDEVTMGLAIAEGLETTLAMAREIAPCWACLDAGNVAAFPVLPGIETLTVGVDNDAAGHKAAQTVWRRWRDAGRECLLIEPPEPGTDLNDLARFLIAG